MPHRMLIATEQGEVIDGVKSSVGDFDKVMKIQPTFLPAALSVGAAVGALPVVSLVYLRGQFGRM